MLTTEILIMSQKKCDIKIIIIEGKVITPRQAVIAPLIPAIFFPTAQEIFMAITPGND